MMQFLDERTECTTCMHWFEFLISLFCLDVVFALRAKMDRLGSSVGRLFGISWKSRGTGDDVDSENVVCI